MSVRVIAPMPAIVVQGAQGAAETVASKQHISHAAEGQ